MTHSTTSKAAVALPHQYRGRHDLLGQARMRLDTVGAWLQLPRGLADRIFMPQRVVQTYSPVLMDDGELRVFPGYRVEHSNILGPYFGGLRYHQEVDLDQISALALQRSLQCALLGLPFGGAKGGVTVDPYALSAGERERLTRRFAADMTQVFTPNKDIPGPDVGTTDQEMAWIMDTLSTRQGHALPAAVAGKPLSIGGTLLNREAPGLGVSLVIEETYRRLGKNLMGATVAIEGFGRLGRIAAQILYREGARIVAVCDRTGGFYDPEGLDVIALAKHAVAHGSLEGASQGQPLSADELLLLPVDILVPASLSGRITKSNAERVRAALVCEAANMAITPEADRLLAERDVLVVPDLLANGGGAIVAYFEWVQDNQHLFWSEEEVIDRLKTILFRAFDKAWRRADRDGVSLRFAAHLQAVGILEAALGARGLYP